MGIRTLLLVATVLLIAMTVATGFALYRTRDARTGAVFASEIVRDVFDLNILADEYLTRQSDRPRRQWHIRHQSLVDLLHALPDQFPQGRAEAELLLRDAELLHTIFLRLSGEDPVADAGTDPHLDEMWRARLTADLMGISQSAVTTATHLSRVASSAEEAAEQRLHNLLLVFVGSSACLVLGLWTIFVRRVLKRLGRLQQAIGRLENGELGYRIDMGGDDEFSRVATAFDGMAGRLEKAAEDLARTNADLARSNKDLEHFAYVASHDLKAPLRAIDNLAGWIAEDLGDQLEGEPKSNLQLLQGRVKRMEGLLDDILEYSRAGRVNGPVVDIDTNTLISDVVEMIHPPAGMAIAVPSAMPSLKTVKGALQQVFSNLIVNAIKHHDRPEGRIEVTARDKGDVYEFAVADDGPGIPPEYHERVCQMFQSLKPRDDVEGSGMGLAIVKKLIEVRNGSLTIDSPDGERGTTFRFEWPKG